MGTARRARSLTQGIIDTPTGGRSPLPGLCTKSRSACLQQGEVGKKSEISKLHDSRIGNPKFRNRQIGLNTIHGLRSNLRFRNFGFPMRESCSFEISDSFPTCTNRAERFLVQSPLLARGDAIPVGTRLPSSHVSPWMIHQVDHRRTCEPLEVVEVHPNRVIVTAGVEFNALVLLERGVAVRRDPKQNSKRWHGSEFAGWKRIDELLFSREPHVFRPCDELQVIEVYSLIGGYDGEQQCPVGSYYHGLGQFFAGHVERLGGSLSGICSGMHMVLEGHTFICQVLCEFC